YLDQSFLSHAFRAGIEEFVHAAKLIDELADAQLLVCPYSSIHETETHQWRHLDQARLWEFIKRTSRGHAFQRESDVRHTQICRGFVRFLSEATTSFSLERNDAVPSGLNDWDDYFRIDVPIVLDNAELIRTLKMRSAEQ